LAIIKNNSNWVEAVFLNQRIKFRNIIRNEEINCLKFFINKTKISCENIIHYKNYIFFFVKPHNFQKANKNLNILRKHYRNKKILIIKYQDRMLDLIYAFFPSINIKKVKLLFKTTGDIEVLIFFSHYKDRGIAIGKEGNFIKILNEIFKQYIYPVKISCP